MTNQVPSSAQVYLRFRGSRLDLSPSVALVQAAPSTPTQKEVGKNTDAKPYLQKHKKYQQQHISLLHSTHGVVICSPMHLLECFCFLSLSQFSTLALRHPTRAIKAAN